jgi:hypothetical protein
MFLSPCRSVSPVAPRFADGGYANDNLKPALTAVGIRRKIGNLTLLLHPHGQSLQTNIPQ